MYLTLTYSYYSELTKNSEKSLCTWRAQGNKKWIFNEMVSRGAFHCIGTGSVDDARGDHSPLFPPLIINKEQIDVCIQSIEKAAISVKRII